MDDYTRLQAAEYQGQTGAQAPIEIKHDHSTEFWGELHSLHAERNYILFFCIVKIPNEAYTIDEVWWEGQTPDMSPQNIHIYIALLQRARTIMGGEA